MWSAQLEQSLAGGDWVANTAYFMVVSVCAPIWEEVRSATAAAAGGGMQPRPQPRLNAEPLGPC
jgi:hypothetical protein